MLIKADTISEAWELSICQLLSKKDDEHAIIPTERGATALEIINLQLSIIKPFSYDRISTLYPHTEFKDQYSKQLLSQTYLNQVYSRITHLDQNSEQLINQQSEIVQKFKSEWFSRRAVVCTWVPHEDINSEHPPCICLLQYLIRDNKLHLTAYLRSNDAWLCTPVDILAITDMQKEVADQLDLKIGTYCHFALSYHLYDYDIPAALNAFKDRL